VPGRALVAAGARGTPDRLGGSVGVYRTTGAFRGLYGAMPLNRSRARKRRSAPLTGEVQIRSGMGSGNGLIFPDPMPNMRRLTVRVCQVVHLVHL
jgi:hypothetical protein